MKKTLTINLAGYVFHIDEDAYYLLDNYIQNLKNYFKNENDANEIVHDMEQRISELFTEKLKSTSREVITVQDVESIIEILGKPEQMSGVNDDDDNNKSNSNSSEYTKKRLYRDNDDKVLGGVCSGLAAYFGWDVTLVRIAFIILGIFVHGTILAYIIAWIVIPPARTATEKLSMQGKKINVENIGKTVTDGFDKVKSKVDSAETRSSLQKFGDGFVTFVGFLIKIILILLAICLSPVIFALLIVFFVLIFVATGLIAATPAMLTSLNCYIPMFDWTIVGASPIASIAVAIAGIFIIGIPIVGLIHMFMRYFCGWQPMSTTTRVIFILLWFIAVGFGVYYSFHLSLIGTHFLPAIIL